jgi:hypothetical protein
MFASGHEVSITRVSRWFRARVSNKTVSLIHPLTRMVLTIW